MVYNQYDSTYNFHHLNILLKFAFRLNKAENNILDRLHFVSVSSEKLKEFGIWIPELLEQWSCQDHNCGLDQVLLTDNLRNGEKFWKPNSFRFYNTSTGRLSWRMHQIISIKWNLLLEILK